MVSASGTLMVDGQPANYHFVGDGSGLTGVIPADNSVTAAKLASDPASLAKVSGGELINTGGKIGLGTASPQVRLEVSDYDTQLQLNQDLSSDGVSQLRFTQLDVLGSRWDLTAKANNFTIYSGTFNAEMLRLDSSGLTVRGTLASSSDRERGKTLKSFEDPS